MSSYSRCLFFDEDLPLKNDEPFTVEQSEVVLDTSQHLGNNKAVFRKTDVTYTCTWIKGSNFTPSKPTIIIPIKDNKYLIDITLANFAVNDVLDLCNVVVVDDRSTEDVRTSATSNNLSYLRVDNDKGFNFSMLNNIAAKICSTLGNTQILLWNSDLWVPDKEMLVAFIELHNSHNACVSGAKLLYPPQSMSLNDEVDSANIIANFPHMTDGRWRETVQFGGDVWLRVPKGHVAIHPSHYRRFTSGTDARVNCNRGSNFVTGALQMWDLDKYISLGGLNPSLAKNYQDVDICLRAVATGESCYYFGKDIHFYHDESPSLVKEGKNDSQMFSDHVLFGKIWNATIHTLVF